MTVPQQGVPFILVARRAPFTFSRVVRVRFRTNAYPVTVCTTIRYDRTKYNPKEWSLTISQGRSHAVWNDFLGDGRKMCRSRFDRDLDLDLNLDLDSHKKNGQLCCLHYVRVFTPRTTCPSDNKSLYLTVWGLTQWHGYVSGGGAIAERGNV